MKLIYISNTTTFDSIFSDFTMFLGYFKCRINLICQKDTLWKKDESFSNKRLFWERRQAIPWEKYSKPGDLEKSVKTRRELIGLLKIKIGQRYLIAFQHCSELKYPKTNKLSYFGEHQFIFLQVFQSWHYKCSSLSLSDLIKAIGVSLY